MDGSRDRCGEEGRNTYCVGVVEIEHLEDVGVDGMKIKNVSWRNRMACHG